MPSDGNPTAIRSLAVTVEDVVTALELNRTTARRAVLRVTPPFSGRMRARLHVTATDSDAPADGTLHVDPESLVAADAPEYPTAADTEDALRADPEATYTVERHHERHLDTVASWRRAVADAIRSRAAIETPAGSHDVEVRTLGDVPAGKGGDNGLGEEATKRDENAS